MIRPLASIKRLNNILSFPPALHSYLPLLPKAIRLSSLTRIGVYDCLYVTLAEREGCELVTADVRLLNTLKPTFPFIIDLASLP